MQWTNPKVTGLRVLVWWCVLAVVALVLTHLMKQFQGPPRTAADGKLLQLIGLVATVAVLVAMMVLKNSVQYSVNLIIAALGKRRRSGLVD